MIRAEQKTDELDFRILPNPFTTCTRFLLISGKDQEVTLEIFNFSRLRVMAFPGIDLARGTQQVIWNGKDAYGNSLPAGIYICKVSGDDQVITRKVVKVE
jgi:flagellar hook assembly protein FlgD